MILFTQSISRNSWYIHLAKNGSGFKYIENTERLKVVVDGPALHVQISICCGSQLMVWQRTWICCEHITYLCILHIYIRIAYYNIIRKTHNCMEYRTNNRRVLNNIGEEWNIPSFLFGSFYQVPGNSPLEDDSDSQGSHLKVKDEESRRSADSSYSPR